MGFCTFVQIDFNIMINQLFQNFDAQTEFKAYYKIY